MLNKMLKEHRYWSKQVQLRDCYTCQCCGAMCVRLCAHHLEGDPDREFDLDNGITLCMRCHMIEHQRFYGKSTAERIRGREGRLPTTQEFFRVYHAIKMLDL